MWHEAVFCGVNKLAPIHVALLDPSRGVSTRQPRLLCSLFDGYTGQSLETADLSEEELYEATLALDAILGGAV